MKELVTLFPPSESTIHALPSGFLPSSISVQPVTSACGMMLPTFKIGFSPPAFSAFSSYDGLLSRLLTDQVHYQVMTSVLTLSSLSELIKRSD